MKFPGAIGFSMVLLSLALSTTTDAIRSPAPTPTPRMVFVAFFPQQNHKGEPRGDNIQVATCKDLTVTAQSMSFTSRFTPGSTGGGTRYCVRFFADSTCITGTS